MSNKFSQSIIDMIAPSMGEFFAKSAVIASCRMANTEPEKLTQSKLKPVADKIEIMLSSRLGPEAAKSIKEKVIALA